MIILPASEVRAKWAEILRQVKQSHEVVIITRFGSPAAVLINYDDYRAMREREDLEDSLALYQRQDDERVPFKGQE